MTENSMTTILRRTAIGLLLTAIGFGAWHLPRQAQSAPDPFEGAEARLTERVAEYAKLRLADDWIKLYDFVAPDHKRLVPAVNFLKHYGHGVLQVHKCEPKTQEIDPATRIARTTLAVEAQLMPDRLPPTFRRGFREDHPEHLTRKQEQELAWTWIDGEWYFLLDREFLTGRDSSGQELQSVWDDPGAGSAPPPSVLPPGHGAHDGHDH